MLSYDKQLFIMIYTQKDSKTTELRNIKGPIYRAFYYRRFQKQTICFMIQGTKTCLPVEYIFCLVHISYFRLGGFKVENVFFT